MSQMVEKPSKAEMGRSNKKIKKQSKLKELLKSPTKFFSKLKDFYVKIIVMCDGQMGGYGGGAVGCPAHCPTVLPRSFSTTGGTGDTELIKAGLGRTGERRPVAAPGGMVLARSYSVGIGRIDEDEVCEFGEEVMVRTRSYADPTGRKVGVMH